MNKNIGIIVGIVVLVLVGGGIYASMNNKDVEIMPIVEPVPTVVENTDSTVTVETNAPMDTTTDTDTTTEENNTPEAGSYEAYAPEKLARAETGDVVLFFHASWCPSCRSLNTDIEKNVADIPAGVSILKTDYDKESELKKKYGITYQHTLVQVDREGNLIKKWSGSPSLTSLLSQIQ